MNKRGKIITAILMILMLLFCGCQKQYPPDEVKTIVAENFALLKEAADLTISKNLSFPISMYELKEVQGLTEAELRTQRDGSLVLTKKGKILKTNPNKST